MIVLRTRLPFLLMLIICFLTLGGCKQKNTEIITAITLKDITDNEYKQISTSSKPEGAKIDDFRKLCVDVKITNSKKATDRTITIPNLFIIDKYDRVRTIGGGSFEQNNIGTEETIEKNANIILDIRELNEQDLRTIYSKSEIYISYKLKNSNLVEKRISIGDSMRVTD